MAEPSAPLLSVEGLSVAFGGLRALDAVDLRVEHGELCGLIGPNGAGKSTLFNCLSRLYRPTAGSIAFDGIDLLKRHGHQVATAGIGRTFQGAVLFPRLTTLENVLVGGSSRINLNPFRAMLGLPSVRRDDAAARERALAVIASLRLERVAGTPAGELSFAVRKRVDIARALMCEPRLLLLDEPASGLNHVEVQELRELLVRLHGEHGFAVILVEHHLSLVMAVSDRVCVLETGRKIADGPPAQVQEDPAVIEAYMGRRQEKEP